MRFIYVSFLLLSLIGCNNNQSPNTLLIGTIAGPETALVETAKEIALKEYSLNIKVVEFNDYNLPNRALEDGSLDANVYQHQPYLDAAIKAHDYHLEVIGKTFIYPMGVYSHKYKTLQDLPENALIALPNDPSNEARALLLLQDAGLITLKAKDTNNINGIETNPKHLKFKELDAAQLPRVLQDVDAAVINTTFAIPAGLIPTKDALFLENKNSPYANLVVIKQGSRKSTQLLLFMKALHSQAVIEKAQSLFKDSAIPAWR